jgi:3-phenylpropionate/trans-cinnamate dioxygenase ferredoxin reductase component
MLVQCKYLIVGGGMTADAAVQGIRELDPSGAIVVVGSEPHAPYNRPPLTKALWKGEPLDSVWRRTTREGVDLRLGRTVTAIDPQHRRATDHQDATYTWEKLLLATGGTPPAQRGRRSRHPLPHARRLYASSRARR